MLIPRETAGMGSRPRAGDRVGNRGERKIKELKIHSWCMLIFISQPEGAMGSSHMTLKLAAAPFLLLLLPGLRAQDGSSKAADTAAIKQVFRDFYESFSRQDAHGTAMTFAEDGDFTNMFGIHVQGREAIEQRFAALFKGNLRGANRTDTVRSIRFYAPDVAFVDAETVITGTKTADGSVGPVRKGLMIAVMSKQNERWYISNFHEAEYPNRAVPAVTK
jgi:uncharacterized protein (TIGR02246 family)